jgi:threonine synthase
VSSFYIGKQTMTWQGVISAYRSYLPFENDTPIVTLNEGNTPLIPAPRLAEALAPGAACNCS